MHADVTNGNVRSGGSTRTIFYTMSHTRVGNETPWLTRDCTIFSLAIALAHVGKKHQNEAEAGMVIQYVAVVIKLPQGFQSRVIPKSNRRTITSGRNVSMECCRKPRTMTGLVK